MRMLTFQCPTCKVMIIAPIGDVMKVGFSCLTCGGAVGPDAVFKQNDRKTELLAWVGEATINYLLEYGRQMKRAQDEKLSPYDRSIQEILFGYSMEVQKRSLIYMGDNYGDKNELSP